MFGSDQRRDDGPQIVCPECGERTPLASGWGPVGYKSWLCPNGHAFHQHDERRAAERTACDA